VSIIAAALGRMPGDLLIQNVRLANVITGELYPAEITVYDDRIVAVEPPGTLPRRRVRQLIDGGGRVAVPGLVDSHMHIESSLVTPAAFAEAVLPHGTTTTAEDPHEVANATGLEGVRRLLESTRGLPLSVYFLAPPCVPAAAGLEHSRGELGAEDIAAMLRWEEVIGIAEVMDARAVVEEDPRMSEILEVGRGAGVVIEGHNPMLSGRELMAFVAAGVDSDHTQASPERIKERLRLGITVQLQERYLTPEVVEAVMSMPQLPATVCLVTDDVAPDHLEDFGHLDAVLRHAVALGMPPMQALQAATINPARRLRLHDRGAIVPGRRADIVLVDELERFGPSLTLAAGRVVAEDGRSTIDGPSQAGLGALRGSLQIDRPTERDFVPELPDGPVTVRVIVSHPGATTTEAATREIRVSHGQPELAEEQDLALISVISRGNRGRFTGFVQGLGLRQGAVATTYAHDSHNLTVIGRDRASMVAAATAVIETDGGIAVAEGDSVRAICPLPIAGIISDAPLSVTAARLRAIRRELAARGFEHPHLLMRLSTFTLPVSRGLRITDLGYVQAERRELVPLADAEQMSSGTFR
jgi:adenine deaminase